MTLLSILLLKEAQKNTMMIRVSFNCALNKERRWQRTVYVLFYGLRVHSRPGLRSIAVRIDACQQLESQVVWG